MANGLSVNRLINVGINLQPIAAQGANLNSLLIVGDSNVIDVSQRIRSYNSLEGVAEDFSTTDPEYLAATAYFSQVPQPNQGYIGRWASSATAGLLYCGALSAAEQVIANWNAITAGEFKLAVDGGSATNITCGSFAAAANLNAVANIIQTAVRAEAGSYVNVDVVWNGQQFVFTSGTTGAASAVAPLTAGAASDISVMLKGTDALKSSVVPGIVAETPVEAVAILDANAISWYGLMFAATAEIDDTANLNVSSYVEGAGNPHIFGITSTNAACADPASTTDIAYETKLAGYNRTFVQYSDNAYAVASFFGRALTVNFDGSNTTITMMYKVEPGVVPQNLTATQADALKAKNADVFVLYDTGQSNPALIQYGTVASGAYFDEIFGLDWLRDAIQTAIFNLLYTSPKIPQTDAGNHQITNVINQACAQGVVNGLIAPGVWTGPPIGQIATGQTLASGYYVYAPPIATQSQADREARKSVPFQVLVKLAGAIHTVACIIEVNR